MRETKRLEAAAAAAAAAAVDAYDQQCLAGCCKPASSSVTTVLLQLLQLVENGSCYNLDGGMDDGIRHVGSAALLLLTIMT
jgi:hypothetical protein